MGTIAILVHGFNVWDGGRATIGKLRPFFADLAIPYVMINYGHFGLIETRFKNRKVARTLATAVANAHKGGHQVIVCGHSNGCAIAYLAAEEYGAEIDQAVFINPALDADIAIPVGIKNLHVWHSPSDVPVRLAKWLLVPSNARPWGDMGAKGYIGHSNQVVSFNKESGFEVSSSEHSDMFSPELVTYFGPRVAVQAAAAINVIPSKGADFEGVQAGELRETGGVESKSAAEQAPI